MEVLEYCCTLKSTNFVRKNAKLNRGRAVTQEEGAVFMELFHPSRQRCKARFVELIAIVFYGRVFFAPYFWDNALGYGCELQSKIFK